MCISPTGRSSPTQSLLNITQKQLTMFETMGFFFLLQRYCVMTRGEKAQEVMLGKIDSVSQPGHWRSIPLFTPRDAQSDSRIFQLFISVANRVSVCCNRGLLCLNVFTQSPLAGREAGGAVLATWGRIIFLAVRAALPPLFVFVGACSCRACLRSLCGTVCLSVCLSG